MKNVLGRSELLAIAGFVAASLLVSTGLIPMLVYVPAVVAVVLAYVFAHINDVE